MNPLISIIVPVYNAEKFLHRCMESLIGQDYTDLEIIIVDDGSTDGSGGICDYYAREYDNIRVIHQENKGASLARLNGIRCAKGDYLMFSDSDDYVSPHYVSSLYGALRDMATDVSVCDMYMMPEGAHCVFEEPFCPECLSRHDVLKRFFRYDFWGYCCGCYSRKLFDGLDFPEATVNEDYYVKLQIFSRVEKIAYVPNVLYCYERHAGSLSRQPLSKTSLGEIDNTAAAWEFCRRQLPGYSGEALSIATEAVIKWLMPLAGDKSGIYDDYLSRVKKFISDNFIDILTDSHLLWKLKIVLIARYVRTLPRLLNIN